MKLFSQFPALTDAPLLRDLAPELRDAFLSKAEIIVAEKEQPILQQGKPADAVYLMAEGSVEIGYTSPEGYRIIIGHGGPARALGAIEVVAEKPCAASCTLHAGAAALAWRPDDFRTVLNDPIFRRNFAVLAYTALEHDNSSKAIDQFYTAEQRICRYLGKLAGGGSTFRQSQSYLATAVGCTRQTVNKELSHLKQSGVIEIAKGKVVIINREGLEDRILELDERKNAGKP